MGAVEADSLGTGAVEANLETHLDSRWLRQVMGVDCWFCTGIFVGLWWSVMGSYWVLWWFLLGCGDWKLIHSSGRGEF